MPYITTHDNTRIYFKDWGSGRPIIFSHGWPLSSDAWDEHLFHFASRGYRCIAHDRRGHGRSTQTWTGNDMNTYANDLAELVESLGLKDAIHIGHSTGGGEVARYAAQHGKQRVSGVVLVGSVTPVLAQSDKNPNGVPLKVFDDLRKSLLADRAQMFKDFALPFFGANREGATVSSGTLSAFWRLGMQAGLKNLHDCIAAFSETDQSQDLKQLNVPTLIVHGDDDQVVPIDTTARVATELAHGSTLRIYEGAPHALPTTHRERFAADVLAFIENI